MTKIRFSQIIWTPLPMSCEYCRTSTSMAMSLRFTLQMRCRDHLIPYIHGRDIPKLERWLQAIDQTRLVIRTGTPLSPQILSHHIGELRNTYTWHWLLNARREADASSYKEVPEMRERLDEQTKLSITYTLNEQEDVPVGTPITFDAPASLVHYWTRKDVIEEMLQSGWGIPNALQAESKHAPAVKSLKNGSPHPS